MLRWFLEDLAAAIALGLFFSFIGVVAIAVMP